MDFGSLLQGSLAFALAIAISVAIMAPFWRKLLSKNAAKALTPHRDDPDVIDVLLVEALKHRLPDFVVTRYDTNISAEGVAVATPSTRFSKLARSYWAKQLQEKVPACVICPRDAEDLSKAIKIIKERCTELEMNLAPNESVGLFAVRSGGHCPVYGASSIHGGVLIDLSLLNTVAVAEDEARVVIGAGCKSGEVTKVLDARGLAMCSGRNSSVGVGGYLLGGRFLHMSNIWILTKLT
jgi:hypothetical protein